jgi:hypothetical protein
LQGIADAGEKLRLLQSLNLTDVLQQLPPAQLDEEVAAKLAELVNSFATQLLSLWDDVCNSSGNNNSSSSSSATTTSSSEAAQAAAAMLSAVVPLLWLYLSHSDVTVTQSVIPATTRLVQVLKKELSPPAAKPGNKGGGPTVTADVAAAGSSSTSSSGASQQQQQQQQQHLFSAAAHAPQLLSVVYTRMQYPPEFTFDATDEDEGEEDQLRSALRKVLVNTCRACPELVLQFLCSALQALPAPLSALPWPAAEAALRLLYHFSEGCAGKDCSHDCYF